MEIDPVNKALLGGFFVLTGLIMVIFHKQVRLFHEDLFGNLHRFWPGVLPRGTTLTAFIIVFGVLAIIGGGIVLLLALPI